jgi:hypothetical protein
LQIIQNEDKRDFIDWPLQINKIGKIANYETEKLARF